MAAAQATPKASLEADPGIVLLPRNAAPWRLPRWRHDSPPRLSVKRAGARTQPTMRASLGEAPRALDETPSSGQVQGVPSVIQLVEEPVVARRDRFDRQAPGPRDTDAQHRHQRARPIVVLGYFRAVAPIRGARIGLTAAARSQGQSRIAFLGANGNPATRLRALRIGCQREETPIAKSCRLVG